MLFSLRPFAAKREVTKKMTKYKCYSIKKRKETPDCYQSRRNKEEKKRLTPMWFSLRPFVAKRDATKEGNQIRMLFYHYKEEKKLIRTKKRRN